MDTTVVQLTPRSGGNNTLSVKTFDDAFGQYSELRGRGRARRHKRRTERQQNRIARRRARKQARMEMRKEKMMARQERKMLKKQGRLARKALGKEEEEGGEDGSTEEGGSSDDSLIPVGMDSSTGEEGTTEGEEESPQGGGGYEEEGGGEEEEGYGEESEGFDGEDTLQGAEDTFESGYRGAEDYYLNAEGEAIPANPKVQKLTEALNRNKARVAELEGKLLTVPATNVAWRQKIQMGLEKHKARVAELEGMLQSVSNAIGDNDAFYLQADGEIKPINPKIKQIAIAIEGTKADIVKLEARLARNASRVQELTSLIATKKARVAELEAQLQGYSGAMGAGLHAKNRDEEIRRARRLANKVLEAAAGFAGKDPRGAYDTLKKVYPESVARRMATELTNRKTPVSSVLQPEISRDKIVIPPSESTSGATGTGLIGIDDAGDYDAPDPRKFDLRFSSADGSDDFYNADGSKKSKINLTHVAIGLGIGVLAVLIIKKYKLLGVK